MNDIMNKENKQMKKNIAVVAGGYSSEYEISLGSANFIMDKLPKDKYNPFLVVISKEEWKAVVDNNEFTINRSDFSFTDNNNKTVKFDTAYIIIHGNPGENGKIQAYFDLLNIPYTTGGQLSSAITFDKFICKSYLKDHHINTAKSLLIKRDYEINPKDITAKLGLPVFVKPNNGGSSFGVTKVKRTEDILPAIEKAFNEDDEVIIEEFIDGKEFTCGVIDLGDEIITLPVTEIISKNEFFDYEAKYNPELADEITPANIPAVVSKNCQKISENIYKLLNCQGIVRVDYLYADNQFFFMEINTVPGMSPNSIIPKQLDAEKLDVSDILSKVVENAGYNL